MTAADRAQAGRPSAELRQRQQRFADQLLAALAEGGARHVVVSPGSRSTPLALAAARLAAALRIEVHVVVDERAAGFFALGLARRSGRPAVLLCTSGSAPFHYLPAVIEADRAFVPLVVLSADRPPELHGRGAPQTVPQRGMLEPFARRSLAADPGTLPDVSAAGAAAETMAADLLRGATNPVRPGPAHANVHLRKPLEPPDGWPGEAAGVGSSAGAPAGPRSRPLASVEQAASILQDALEQARRPLVLLGPRAHGGAGPPPARPVLPAGLPLAVEAASGLRFLPMPGATVLSAHEALLRSAELRARLKPDLVVQVGGTPVSTGFDQWMREQAPRRIVLSAHGWPDPWRSAEAVLLVPEPLRALWEVAERAARRGAAERWSAWTRWLERLDGHASSAIAERRRAQPPDSEAYAVAAVLEAARAHRAVLVVGNSLPVRQLDLWTPAGAPRDAAVPVLARRGASGIDGMLAEVAGVARAGSDGHPVVLLLGDQTFRHDQGALELLAEVPCPLAVVVLDNGGGRIFDELPLAGHRGEPTVDRAMRDLFRTPGGPSPSRLAEAVGLPGTVHDEAEGLRQALGEALARPGASVLHFRASADPAAARAEAFGAAATAALTQWEDPP